MDEILLPLTEFTAQSPSTTSYIIAKRVAQAWLANETYWSEQAPIAILDLAAGEGEFSDIICDHTDTCDKNCMD